MLKNILVAVDGSDQSMRAARLAGALAGKFDAALTIVHVLLHKDAANLRHMAEVEHIAEPVRTPAVADTRIAAEVRTAMREIAEHSVPQVALMKIGENVVREAEAVARQAGAGKVTTRVVDGDPVVAILDVAQELDADMIVTGKRGHGPLHDLVLGSVSSKLLQLVSCSCVTVH
ncbi:universal stress protein [Hwanghaeella sp.]|uniref:universal stress protein n=1 Tax=Hwanghaeella sp. TaxID=2605943 RepID=UPI003CCC1EB9